MELLILLVSMHGQLVSREEIVAKLWGQDVFIETEHGINTAISKIRQVLGDGAERSRFVQTVVGKGYRFIAAVRCQEATVEEKLLPNSERNPEQPVQSAADLALAHDVFRDESGSSRRSGPNYPTRVLAAISVEATSHVLRRWKVDTRVIASVGLLLLAAPIGAYWISRPLPQPKIVGSHILTKTGNPKPLADKLLTDRGSIYFFEKRPSSTVVLQVPAVGGEVSEGPAVNGDLVDISRDGSQALSQTRDPKTNRDDVWTQSFPAGTSRLIVKDASKAAWAADGRSIFFTRNATELYIASSEGTNVERLATISPVQGGFHLSPDGSRIRFTESSEQSRMWEVSSGGSSPRLILDGREGVWGGSWSPDGKYYFFTGWDGERWSLSVETEERRWWRRSLPSQPLTFGPMSIGNPAISDDGKQLYAVGRVPRGELSIYDSKSNKFVPYLSGISACFVDFSRDGQWIAYVSYPEGTLWRSRIDGSEKRQLTSPPLAVINPRWSPNGKSIVFTDIANGDRRQTTEYTPTRIFTVSADGGSPELLLKGHFYDPTWSTDGRSIAYNYSLPSFTFGEAEVRILNLQTKLSTTLPGSQGIWSPRWSPDGKYLVALAGFQQPKLMLFNFARNAWLELASGGYFGWPCWSRDSKFVYAFRDSSFRHSISVVRFAMSDHKIEEIVSSNDFQSTAYFIERWDSGWFGVNPDGRPISTRDASIEEIYSFDLQYK
jgi:Tol biopolymer transport system component/DNA-binding winged helix-turn-helix (wHTH) protein